MLVHFASHIVGNLFDFTAPGRSFVQAALRAQHWPGLAALLAERDFTTLPTQNDVAPTVDRCTATQDRTLVQAAVGTESNTLLAALFALVDLPAQPAQRDLSGRVVRMGHAERLLFATREQNGKQSYQSERN
jgi:hypothetical protein